MKEAHGCIYRITNLTNGKRYVGQYKNALTAIRRWKRHVGVALNTDDTRPLYRALRKAWRRDGNLDTFTFKTVWCGPVEKLHEKEIHYIAKLHTFNGDPLGDRSYNLTKGGDGVRGLVWSAVSLKRLGEASRRQWANLAWRENMRAIHRSRYEEQGAREKTGTANRQAYENNPALRIKMRVAVQRAYKDQTVHEKLRTAAHHRWSRPEAHEKARVVLLRRFKDPTERQKLSLAQLRRYESQSEREKTSVASKYAWAKRTPEDRAIIGRKISTTKRRKAK